MKTSGKIIGEEAFLFMQELYDHNRKEWFDANRPRYEEFVKRPMKALAESLAGPVSTILPDFSGKYKISRINNDIRFAPDKPPYKEHMWISFGRGGESGADLFAGISRNGWAAGCCTCGSKREHLDGWRNNLVEHQDLWRKYSQAAKWGEKVMAHHQQVYKKPLFPDIPEDLSDLIQTKGVWIVEDGGREFQDNPERDIFQGLCRMLPFYLFMKSEPDKLREEFSRLRDRINAPSAEVKEMWRLLV
ncbi:MAG: DUF2461 domain-containing protein [FCB group bacterium]|nr:DUF2461 domain-containing protein [FCB group bacterium]